MNAPLHWSHPKATIERILADIAEIGKATKCDAISKQQLRDLYRNIRDQRDVRLYRNRYDFVYGLWEDIARPSKPIEPMVSDKPFFPW